jgi:outer membrane protein TolC
MAQEAGLKSRSDVALAQLQLATTEFESQKTIYQALLAKLRLNLLTAKNDQAVETAVEQMGRWLYGEGPKTSGVLLH